MLSGLLKDSIVYGIGTIIPKGFAFLVIPIIIGYFSPGDYGKLEIVLTFCALLQLVMGLGLDSAQSFYFFKYKRQKNNVVKTILYARLINGALVVAVSVLFSAALVQLIGLEENKQDLLIYAFLFSFFAQIFTQLNEVSRLIFKPIPYVLLVNLQVALNQGFSILFAVYLDFGIEGYFQGLFIGTGITCFLAIFIGKKWIVKGSFDKRILYKSLVFSLPLLPASVSMYFMTSLDRWMVNFYLDPEYLGVFALGAKVAIAFKLAIDVFRKAWWPHSLKALYMPEGKDVFRMISIFYALVASFGLICSAYIIPLLIEYFGDSNYKGAGEVAVILCIEAVVYGYFLVGGIGIWKSGKTYINTILMVLGLIVNVILNVILIPKFGLNGAAFATVLSSLVWCLLSILISNKYWNFYANNFLIIFLMVSSVLIVFHVSRLFVLAKPIFILLLMGYVVISVFSSRRLFKIIKIIKGQ
jgi:O-antigen/teichoic acid export membrane protein